MTRISAALALLLPVCQDDPRLAELQAADRERIRSRDPLTRLEQELYMGPAALVPWSPAVKAVRIRVRVIPVGFRDRPPPRELSWLGSLRDFLTKQSDGVLQAEIEDGPAVALSRTYADALSLSKNSSQESEFVAQVFRSAGVDPSKLDALILVYSGGLVRNRQSVLWPHQASLTIGGKTLRYTIAPAEGSEAAAIHAHEFLHLLGASDKPSNRHCILAFGYEMLDVCGGCRALLGWAKVGSVDASKETLVSVGELSRFGEVVRIQVSRTGEALLVELRGGLLFIWHDLRGRLDLVASLDGRSADRLTPFSSPGFRGRSRGSVPVYITDLTIDPEIQRAFFKVSDSGELTDLEKHLISKTGRSLGGDQ